jgi:hypothetical protein
VRTWAAIGLLVAVGLSGRASAAGPAPVASLTEQQVRWFVPGELRTGDLIRCVARAGVVEAKVPPPPSAGLARGTGLFAKSGASIQIARRPNGATEIDCGSGSAPPFRRATLPYVIGQNGVGSIAGPNHLDRLVRLYGRGATSSPGRSCRVTWPKVGLRATFDAPDCARAGSLSSATATGESWSSLSGVHVGDPVARMRWQVPGATLVSSKPGRKVWLLAGGGPAHRSKLLAVSGAAGTVQSLICVIA